MLYWPEAPRYGRMPCALPGVSRLCRLVTAWRRSGAQIEALEDLAGHLWVLDGRDQTHRCATAGTAQRIEFENTLEKLGPREPTRTKPGGGSLPPVAPDVRWRKTVRLGRDHYVRVDTCDYSVHPSAIGARVDVERDLAWVVVRRGTEEVARHRRSLASHRTITDPEHARARREQQRRGPPVPPLRTEVEQRDLAVYDQALGAL